MHLQTVNSPKLAFGNGRAHEKNAASGFIFQMRLSK
jgi:hypothetical protein